MSNRENWQKCKWGDISTLEYGKALSYYDSSIGKVPVYGTNGLIGYTDKALCEYPSVIIGRKGAYRGVHFSKVPFHVIDTAFFLKPKNKDLNLKYAYYQLLTQDINSMDSGSAIPSTSRPDFYNLGLTLPPPAEQCAIADVLSALDDKIELNRRMNKTLEQLAQTLFKHWFLDNPDRDNWEPHVLGELISINKKNVSQDYQYENIEYIDISSVSTGNLESTTFYQTKEAPSRAKRLVNHGDILWSTVRPNRKSYLYISHPKDNVVVSTGFAVLTPEKIPSSFLYSFVISDFFVDYLVSNADGSAYPAVLPGVFARAELLLPPDNLLNDFQSVVDPIREKIACNASENKKLIELRDTLLPKLMSGQVKVNL